MKWSLAQQPAHKPAPSPSGARQAAHSGGSAVSVTKRSTLRSGAAKRASGETCLSAAETVPCMDK